MRSLLERTAATARACKSVSAATYIPMGPSGGGNGRAPRSRATPLRPDERLSVVTDGVGPGYVKTMGMRLLAGREFTAADQGDAPQGGGGERRVLAPLLR